MFSSTVAEDTASLQQALENAAHYAKPIKPRNGEQSASVKEDSLLDHVQWEVLPNGTFIATGYTQGHLPPGAYTLGMTDTGKPIFNSKKILTDSLIDLGDSNAKRIIDGIKLFWTKKDRYKEFGLLYKRGVLFWGDPGSGKTATVSVLAKELVETHGGIVLLIQNPTIATRALPVLRKIEPERPLIGILEDVEEITQAHGEHDLLALLDGEHQTDNVTMLATTNYPEQLGARIVNRPSRFDEVVRVRMPSPEMRECYFRHILKDKYDEHNCDQWVSDTEGMSIAHLKEIIVAVTCLEQDYLDVITRLGKMKVMPKSQMYSEGVGFSGAAGKGEASQPRQIGIATVSHWKK